MKISYESTFISMGASAADSITDNFIITFGEGAPEDVAEYCFIHRNQINENDNITPGALLTLGDRRYLITALGQVACENLRDLGHITLSFDGAGTAAFPGTVHVEGTPPTVIELGQKLRVLIN